MKSTEILPIDQRLTQDEVDFIENNSDDKTKALLVKYHRALAVSETAYASQLTWSIDDIMYQAQNDEVAITEEQGQEILDRVLHQADANMGINWTVISTHISMYLEEQKG